MPNVVSREEEEGEGGGGGCIQRWRVPSVVSRVSVPPKHTWDSADLSPEYGGQQQQPPQFSLCGPVRGPCSPSEGLEDGGMFHREPAHGPPEEGCQVVVGRERQREREREVGGHGDSGASGVGKFGALDVGKFGIDSGGSIKVNPNLMHLLA
jgi:hypothetical protein